MTWLATLVVPSYFLTNLNLNKKMSFSPAASASSVSGSPSDILFTDLSVGSDVAIVSRRIYFSDNTGAFIMEGGSSLEYSLWPLPLIDTITLDLLSAATAGKIVFQWLNVSGTVLYDYTIAAEGFTEFLEEFLYQQTQLMSANPLLINDNNFWQSYSKCRTLTDAGNQAILQASDLYSAQQCYDAATEILNNAQYLFNRNS